MKYFTLLLFISMSYLKAEALMVSEIISNPVGDDGGREWVEIINRSDSSVDVSAATFSVKGGNQVTSALVSGSQIISPGGYAIIASTVSGQTKFLQDYPSYDGTLLKASMSLVNTGTTSFTLYVNGVQSDFISYVAAKEGLGYGVVQGEVVTTEPTPGKENKKYESPQTGDPSPGNPNQVTLSQTYQTLPQLTIFLPKEKKVVAGASSVFNVLVLDDKGEEVKNVIYEWSFGDGGYAFGSSTEHTYHYSGRYILEVEATSGKAEGKGRMAILVHNPDISISEVLYGKYGPYIALTNDNSYELDISGWTLSVDGAGFRFPKNTILGSGITKFSGSVMGFASTTISTSTVIRLLFPSGEEVARAAQKNIQVAEKDLLAIKQEKGSTKTDEQKSTPPASLKKLSTQKSNVTSSTSSSSSNVTTHQKQLPVNSQKEQDTRIAKWIKRMLRAE
jgi:hypothetical protein